VQFVHHNMAKKYFLRFRRAGFGKKMKHVWSIL